MGGKPYRVVAITDRPGYDYPPEVTFEIRQNVIRDYARAAEYLNGSSAQIVSLQHEFGIYGGDAGKYLSVLLSHLKKPVITTVHTILENPPTDYRKAFEDVINFSQRIVTMSQRGARMLREIYDVPQDKISVIHHGVHDVPFVDSNFYKEKFNVEGLTVLLTFGLLSPNKGIETALEALPAVVEKYPNTVVHHSWRNASWSETSAWRAVSLIIGTKSQGPQHRGQCGIPEQVCRSAGTDRIHVLL